MFYLHHIGFYISLISSARLVSVSGEEEGIYRCRAENLAGAVDVTAQLIIHEVPRVRIQPEGSVVMRTGSRLSITCSVTGDPRPAISWRRMSQ